MPRIQKIFYLALWVVSTFFACQNNSDTASEATVPDLAVKRSSKIVNTQTAVFRDLNANGQLDPYEDVRQPMEVRVENLLSQMTLEEKAGLFWIKGVGVGAAGDPATNEGAEGPGAFSTPAAEMIKSYHLTHFNVWNIPADPTVFANWYNRLQQEAEKSRLGIPVTIATDPRHHFTDQGFSLPAEGFSQFCEPLGFAAIGDEEMMRQFAEIVRKEYLALGMRLSLQPQIDLATEPRWARISGGFGANAELTARLAAVYVQTMQGGDQLQRRGIACMSKHFPGGGPQREGLDPHFGFHKGQAYPGDNFNYHLIPFEAVLDANTAAIMPYYGVPTGLEYAEVGFAYNKAIITGLLREKYEYDGVICTDWGLITDVQMGPDVVWKARAWGVEKLSAADRVLQIFEAGCDQFGGESRPELILQLVEEDRLTEERLDQSVRRILRQKFQLGLFENPFVDEKKVTGLVGTSVGRQAGLKSQKRSLTLLKNQDTVLPFRTDTLRIYAPEIDPSVLEDYAEIAESPADADFAILRITTPWQSYDTPIEWARTFHHGDLNFKAEEKARLLEIMEQVPTIVDIYLDRPAVIPDIAEAAMVLIGNYGTSDRALCEVLFGNAQPEGNLPFALPASMEAVRRQLSDVPNDSEEILFPAGFGLRYSDAPQAEIPQ